MDDIHGDRHNSTPLSAHYMFAVCLIQRFSAFIFPVLHILSMFSIKCELNKIAFDLAGLITRSDRDCPSSFMRTDVF